MDEMTLLGYGVSIIITLGAFVAVVQKFTQPINELRIVMQKVLDKLEYFDEEKNAHRRRLDDLDHKYGKLDHRVTEVESKVRIYHDDK